MTHKEKNIYIIISMVIGIGMMTYKDNIDFNEWSFIALISAIAFPI